jgi:hypothetical protein
MVLPNSYKLLALDISTNTGWALFDSNPTSLVAHGLLEVSVEDFNVNNKPETRSIYPRNIKDAADAMALQIYNLCRGYEPSIIVIENTVRGRNRNTQRLLEWIHKSVYDLLGSEFRVLYLDPSQWRKILELRLSKDDKDHNAQVKKGATRGKLTQKHLSVRRVNDKYNLMLKLQDNDIADAINLGEAAVSVFNKLTQGE